MYAKNPIWRHCGVLHTLPGVFIHLSMHKIIVVYTIGPFWGFYWSYRWNITCIYIYMCVEHTKPEVFCVNECTMYICRCRIIIYNFWKLLHHTMGTVYYNMNSSFSMCDMCSICFIGWWPVKWSNYENLFKRGIWTREKKIRWIEIFGWKIVLCLIVFHITIIIYNSKTISTKRNLLWIYENALLFADELYNRQAG